jgi:transposase-like protein
MRKCRFSKEQMVAALRDADKPSAAAAAKKHKVSEPTIYSWRQHFNGMEPAKTNGSRVSRSRTAGWRYPTRRDALL